VLKRIHIDGCRYNARLNVKTEGSKLLGSVRLGCSGRNNSKPSNGSKDKTYI
jgi:hypothetical protein